MRRPFPLILAGLGLVAATAPASADTRGYRVGGFDRIRSDVPFDVRVRTGAAPAVRADGSRELLDRLMIETKGGALTISVRRERGWFSGFNWSGQKAVIWVTVPTLSAATLNGPGNLLIDHIRNRSFAATLNGPGDLSIGALQAGDLQLALTGPGDISVAGTAGRAHIVGKGPGNVRGERLTVQDANVELMGPGNVTLVASRTADVRLYGPGDVRIGGHPRCTVAKHGPGEVRCG